MQHYLSVNRIEDNQIAVLEFDIGELVEMPVKLLPKGTKENDVLKVIIEQDEAEKEKRIKEISNL